MSVQFITPSSPPQFPCWLWGSTIGQWAHFSVEQTKGEGMPHHSWTHWHCDQSTIPTARPSIPKPDKPIRMVVCAANRVLLSAAEGQLPAVYAMALGPRHYDPTMRDAIINAAGTRELWRSAEQGFIDQWGVFMTREEAWVVAVAAGQVRYGPHLSGGRLDSSDIY